LALVIPSDGGANGGHVGNAVRSHPNAVIVIPAFSGMTEYAPELIGPLSI
jgi:hypothetical protein